MKSLVLLLAVVALCRAVGAAAVNDQESQASDSVSKRGAARLTPVSSNSIADSPLAGPTNAPQQAPLSSQPQHLTFNSQQTYNPQQQAFNTQTATFNPQQGAYAPQQPLYAPHPYSFVQPHPYFQYQSPLLHSKYQAPGKTHLVPYVQQPYLQVPYQAPLMYIVPQQPVHQVQAHQQGHAQAPQAQSQEQQPQQYVMLYSAPAPAASGFQYFAHPHASLPGITFYAGPHGAQPHAPQQLIYQSQPVQSVLQSESQQNPGDANNQQPIQFVQKQSGNSGLPQGLEAPTPATLVGSYGARLAHQQHQQPQHTFKTIIKA